MRLGTAVVTGRSMEPTLHEGDRLLVLYGARPRADRLALVTLPPDAGGAARPLAVKRVTGRDPSGGVGWWVERDNPHEGVDSWTVGAIAPDDVHALVLTRIPHPRLHRLRPRRRGHG